MATNQPQVRDVMSSPAITVEPTASTADVVACLLDNHIGAAPVVDRAQRLVGIVTASDLTLRAAYGKTDQRGLELVAEIIQGRPAPWLDRVHAHTAADLMTDEVVTCSPEESVVDAARRMLFHHCKQLPVVASGTVVGILGRHDLLRTLASEDPQQRGVIADAGPPLRDFVALSPAECQQLIRLKDHGRVGYIVNNHPVILPVNYIVDNGLIVFRSDPGEKLNTIPMRHVAFEVDDIQPGDAWSVLVKGHAREVTTALGPTYEALRAIPIPARPPAPKNTGSLSRSSQSPDDESDTSRHHDTTAQAVVLRAGPAMKDFILKRPRAQTHLSASPRPTGLWEGTLVSGGELLSPPERAHHLSGRSTSGRSRAVHPSG